MPTVTEHCPRWFAHDHESDAAFYHASEAASVVISRPGGRATPDRLDVQTAQYLPDEPGEPAWSPTVEIAVHTDGLTPDEARHHARMLPRAADITAA